LTGITRHETWTTGMARGDEKWWRHGGRRKGLIVGVHMSVIGKRDDSGIRLKTPRACTLTGLVRQAVACGGRAGRCGKLGRLGRIPGKIQIRI
jgi:hypothetical protein